MNPLEIVILDSNQRTLDELGRSCEPIGAIRTQKVDRVIYTRPPEGIDALFLVLPAAEKWGAKPIPGEAKVVRTSPEDQRDGMPLYVITGVILRPTDPRGPLSETKLLISAALDAVRQFNLANKGEEIQKLGFWAVNLLNGVTPEQLATLFNEVGL